MITPLIFVHKGHSAYLDYSLRQAHAHSPTNPILLLSDQKHGDLPYVDYIKIADYAHFAKQFTSLYRHYSTNRYEFELFCFQRWLLIAEVMRRLGLPDAFVCDSDVLLYVDIATFVRQTLRSYHISLSIPEHQGPFDWVASGHSSYWTRSIMHDFCTFLLESFTTSAGLEYYRKKWSYHVENRVRGGVCDMTALFLFAADQRAPTVFNSVGLCAGSTFDHSIRSGRNQYDMEYEVRRGRKHIRWIDGMPHVLRLLDGKTVRFHSLHFQGKAKLVLPRFYTGRQFVGMRTTQYVSQFQIYFGATRGIFRRLSCHLRSMGGRKGA